MSRECIIRPDELKESFVEEKITFWIEAIQKFGRAAKMSPQAAYTAFTKSLQFKWSFLQKVTSCPIEKYISLKEAVQIYLTPTIIGRGVFGLEHYFLYRPE